MKQIPYAINTIKELQSCVEEVREESRSLKQLSSVLVSVFMDTSKKAMLEEIQKSIRAVFPEAQMIGSVSSGDIVNGQLLDRGVVVNFTLFEESTVRVFAYDFQEQKSSVAGRELLAILQADKEATAVEVITTGFHLDINPFLKQLSAARRKLLFFGGMADDGSLGKDGLVFTQTEQLRYGAVTAVFSGSSLHVQGSSSFGWKPLGHSMTVTKMDGDFCLQELDGRPPLEVFERYLAIKNTDHFLEDALTFPFYFERNGTVLARHPRRCREDGSMMFGADFRVGEQVRLAYGDPGDVIDNAMALQEKMASFKPEAIFVVSCVARWMLLGSDTEKELAICKHLAPSSGFYAYGEFMRNIAGEIMVSNMTLVTVGMREGLRMGRQSNIIPPRPKLNGHRSIMARLVHFIETTTQELEESNRKLAHLAQIDRLTGLFNRGETEVTLQEMLEKAHEFKEPLSVLMMDVDDFKVINDTYGHAVGDDTLKTIAKVLRKNTRRGVDVPGRWGGDEFFVIFSGISSDKAQGIARRISKLIAQHAALPDGSMVTVSIGVVTAASDDEPDTLFKRADAALYEAKLIRGKNNVVVH
ncbi:MAG: GGDEF domain-containing protein [Selenomonas sp.]|uniref:sensor domain-containing diguanylate cyclase n=1 Tax=Selenomonas sp. TaxID=2053611 RepID=UPI0025E0C342|nr:GGDEF domain-containing protein [Selenomonas sp.]MCR5758155.1 GGDEF domain-containing protein [Selenomonas sp.]